MDNNFNNFNQYNYSPADQPGDKPGFTMSQMRAIARQRLAGKWAPAGIAIFIYMLLAQLPITIITLLSTPDYGIVTEVTPTIARLDTIITLYTVVITGAFLVSIAGMALNIIRGGSVSIGSIFAAFPNRPFRSILLYLGISFFSALQMMLISFTGALMVNFGFELGNSTMVYVGYAVLFIEIIIAAVVVMKYRMSYFIAHDTDLSAGAIIRESKSLMKGQRSRYLLLLLSFTGWAIVPFILMCISVFAYFQGADTGNGVYFMTCYITAALALALYSLVYLYGTTTFAVLYSELSGNFRTQAQEAEAQVEDKPSYDINL